MNHELKDVTRSCDYELFIVAEFQLKKKTSQIIFVIEYKKVPSDHLLNLFILLLI